MKISLAIFFAVISCLTLHAGQPADDKTFIDQAKATYPLKVCVVSGETIVGGDMGQPIDFVYKQEGKPDRLIRFCCKDCENTFKANPDKYLAKIDAAGK